MQEKVCAKCKNEVKKDLITYKTKVWDELIQIPMVEGYECRECGHIEVDEKVADRLKVKVLEHKLEMYKNGKVKILLVSDIKDVREEKGVSQGAIGDALDFTEQRFGAIERNYNTPTVYLAGVIAELLGVSIYDFYRFEPVPMDVFLELENLDQDFNIIEGLPEIRKKHYMALDEQRRLRAESNDLKVRRRRIATRIENKEKKLKDKNITEDILKEIKEEIVELNSDIKELDKKIEYYDGVEVSAMDKNKTRKGGRKRPKKEGGKLQEIASEVSIYLKEIRALESEGDCILKQGYCLTRKDWDQVIERYTDRLK